MGVLAGLSTLTGGGALSGLNSRTGDVDTGPINVGGIDFGGNTDALMLGAMFAAGIAVALIIKGR